MSAGNIPGSREIHAAGASHTGGRPFNEDAYLLRPDLNLFLVADGAGGQAAGNVASTMAGATAGRAVEDWLRPLDGVVRESDENGLAPAARCLSGAVHQANREVLRLSRGSKQHRGMATTIVAVLLAPTHRSIHIAHVGDSRCYRLRGVDLELLTWDHSLAHDVLATRPAAGKLDPRMASTVTRALGLNAELRVSVRSHGLSEGDRYLLCTDGVSACLSRADIHSALLRDAPAEFVARELVAVAVEAGTKDNATAIVIDSPVLPPRVEEETPVRRESLRTTEIAMITTDGGTPAVKVITGEDTSQEDLDEVTEMMMMDMMNRTRRRDE